MQADPTLPARFFAAFAPRPRPLQTQIVRPSVGAEGDRLRQLLYGRAPSELSPHDLRTELASNLWMLAPEAFRYFLPAFLATSIAHYSAVSVFVSELIGALTKPSRADVVDALERAAQAPTGRGLSPEMADLLRKQQLEWYDSGTLEAIFHERFDALTADEGAAILAFLVALEAAHGADYPFDELKSAIDRHWARFREP